MKKTLIEMEEDMKENNRNVSSEIAIIRKNLKDDNKNVSLEIEAIKKNIEENNRNISSEIEVMEEVIEGNNKNITLEIAAIKKTIMTTVDCRDIENIGLNNIGVHYKIPSIINGHIKCPRIPKSCTEILEAGKNFIFDNNHLIHCV